MHTIASTPALKNKGMTSYSRFSSLNLFSPSIYSTIKDTLIMFLVFCLNFIGPQGLAWWCQSHLLGYTIWHTRGLHRDI